MQMLESLQSILDCIYTIQECRKAAKASNDFRDKLYHGMGEMDYLTELHRQLKELGLL